MACEKTEPTNESISFSEKLKMGYDPMMEGVRWTERYHRRIEKVWNYIPNWLAQILATIAVFLLASGIQGTICSNKENNSSVCDQVTSIVTS